jgi:hypothetical protein
MKKRLPGVLAISGGGSGVCENTRFLRYSSSDMVLPEIVMHYFLC